MGEEMRKGNGNRRARKERWGKKVSKGTICSKGKGRRNEVGEGVGGGGGWVGGWCYR